MYVHPNLKTKKALREAVASGGPVVLKAAGPYDRVMANGRVTVEGPHYPQPHTWYAQVECVDGKIVKVLS